jgi:hypothetical protein
LHFLESPVSNEYTKMFVSRKNLPLIHLVPGKVPVCLDMAETPHKVPVFLRASLLRGELKQPFPKCRIQRVC